MYKLISVFVVFALIGIAGAVVNLSGLNESERMNLTSGNIGLDIASNSLTTSQTAFLKDNPADRTGLGGMPLLIGSKMRYNRTAQFLGQFNGV